MSEAYEEEMQKEWEEESISEGRVVGFTADANGTDYGVWKGFGLRPSVYFREEDLSNLENIIKGFLPRIRAKKRT